ncbi:LAFA_0F09120g1_1 [Lachancea sp. 'fantastica']|nr:LAFA_0F09120g1_1 [Lachancea sp. 'fantastica']
MSERKVINKYYPPNFNPLEAEEAARKLSKKLKTMNKDSTTIRLMTPFSMRCLKCSEFIPRSRKFNGKKELLPERYLETIKKYRLSIKCPRCNNMISFRTDPKSGDYVMEIGGVKNFVADADSSRASNETESVDEALQRLEKEHQQEKDAANNEPTESKIEQVEKRLVKMQQEQEDYERLEHLRRDNAARMKRAEQLHGLSEDAARAKLVDDEKAAEDAFRATLEPQETAKTNSVRPATITVPHKILIKKKNKTNPLGVVKKKRN